MAYCSQAHRLWASSFAIPVIRSYGVLQSGTQYVGELVFRASTPCLLELRICGVLQLGPRTPCLLELRISMAGRFLCMMGIRLPGALNSTATPYLQHTVYGVLQSGCGRVSVFWASTPCLLEPYDSSAKRSVALYYSSAKRSVAYCSQVLRLWASSFSWTNSLPF